MPDVRSIVDKAKHLHVELERVTAERESLERQLARFKARVVELSEQNETVGGQLNRSRGTEGNLRAGQELLDAKLAGLESALAQLRKEHRAAKSQLADSHTQLDLLRRDNDSLRGRLFESESGYKNYSSENEQLETALNETQDKFAIAAKAKDAASAELEEITRERDLFRGETERLTRQVRGRTLKILAIGWAIVAVGCFVIWASYTLSSRAISQELKGTKTEISSLQKGISGHIEDLVAQEILLKGKVKDIRRLEEALSELQAEIQDLNGMILALKKHKDGRIGELDESISFLKKQNKEELEALEHEKDIEIAQFRGKIERLEKQVKKLMQTRAIAIPPLIAALDHPSIKVQNVAASSLAQLTGKKYGTNQEKWNKWWFQNRLKWLGLGR